MYNNSHVRFLFFYKKNEMGEEYSSDDFIIKKINQRSTLPETEIKYWIKTLPLLIFLNFPICKKH